jgi:uncharacterized protein (DUF302 family)
MPDDGFVTIRGAHSAREAIARVKAELDAKGVTVFTKIDHAAGAVAVGLPLCPTALIIFGAHDAQARRLYKLVSAPGSAFR